MDEDRLKAMLDEARHDLAVLRKRNDALEDMMIMASRFKVAPGIAVEERGRGKWCVFNGTDCLNSDGEWEFEPLPSSRDEDFLDRTRFDRETAIRLAKEKANGKKVNPRDDAE